MSCVSVGMRLMGRAGYIFPADAAVCSKIFYRCRMNCNSPVLYWLCVSGSMYMMVNPAAAS